MTLRRLHLWIPEFSGPGGIQAYSRNLTEACSALLPEASLRALVKNGPVAEDRPGLRFWTAGGAPAFLRRFFYAGQLIAMAVRERPDLIIITHLHFAPLARWLRRWLGLRYWIVAHGIEAWGQLTGAQRRALQAADRILPVSDYTAGRLRTTLGHVKPIMERLPNMVNEDRFVPGAKPLHLLRRYGLRSDQPLLLTVARLDPRQRYKGYDLVLDAMVLLRDRLPDLRYLVVGRGSDSCRIRLRVQALGLEKQVILTGFLPERDLKDHYNLCDLFVMPSQAEGFGIVFLEALACGCRVVAGNADGSAEPLLQGELGTLVNPHDARELAESLSGLLNLSSDESARSERLRAKTIEHFGSGAFRNKLNEFFQEKPCAA